MKINQVVPSQINKNTLLESGGYKTFKLGDTTIILEIDPEQEAIHIASVRTPQAKRGKGSARQALQYLIDKADAQGITLTLGASALDKKTNQNKLVKFYQSMGFEPTGRSINFAGDPEMIRVPNTI